ncbi:MAG TPA: hypothetical protein VGQ92_12225 [Actinoplanes sp.]|nr:hypothetical protein [Actinoplanes sp.]
MVLGVRPRPSDRAGAGSYEYPDLLFPQITAQGMAPPAWEPRHLEYLAFTKSTAFSPTDTLSLSRW